MTKTVTATTPVWCPGCGDFGVLASLKKALSDSGIKSKDTVLVGGIGCSGSIHNNLECYGIHALHGRLLPTAILTQKRMMARRGILMTDALVTMMKSVFKMTKRDRSDHHVAKGKFK